MLRGKEFSLNLALYRLCSCYTNLVIYLRHDVFPLAVTSWWSSFHKIWQQSNCSSWLGFSGDSIPPSHYFFLYFCLGLQQIFLFLSWNFHSFIVYTGVCGSFIYVWFFYLCVKREVFHLYALLECNIATFLCFWVVCIKTKEMCACRFLLFCGWLALS